MQTAVKRVFCEVENRGPLWQANLSVVKGWEFPAIHLGGKHHRMSFSSFLNDKMITCVTIFLVILLTQMG